MENACQMLREMGAAIDPQAPDDGLDAQVRTALAARRAAGHRLFGLGHNLHVDGDPRIPALRRVSQAQGFYGHHWRVIDAIGRNATTAARRTLPINAAGAVGAIVADMGLPEGMARGLALVGRTAGLVGHLVEERTAPTGAAIWELVLRQDERNTV